MRLTEILAYLNGERRVEMFTHFDPELDRYLNEQKETKSNDGDDNEQG